MALKFFKKKIDTYQGKITLTLYNWTFCLVNVLYKDKE